MIVSAPTMPRSTRLNGRGRVSMRTARATSTFPQKEERMTNQRCSRHGTYSGTVGCPWCKAEAPIEEEPRVKVMSTRTTPDKGVTVVSKSRPPAGPTVRVEAREVSPAQMAQTKKLLDD